MTTLLLATTGGHLSQLRDLAPRLPTDGPELWVTHDNEQSRSLLSDRDVKFVPYVRVRNLADVARCVPTAHRLWRQHEITRVVSTGSGIALGYLPYLASRGVECHYIESAARVSAPSLTGRLLEWTPRVKRYTQHCRWAGKGWRYGGSVLDRYAAVHQMSRHAGLIRVVVTVGTAVEFPFNRLVERLVPILAPDGPLASAVGCELKVLWQTGCSAVEGLPIRVTPFLGAAELADAVADADIVISHAGTGSVLTALEAGRFPLLVPRSAAHGEAGDGHQAELAGELHARRLAAFRDVADLTVEDLLTTLNWAVRETAAPRFVLS